MLMILRLDPQTRTAIHAPTSQNWTESINYPFGNSKHNPVYLNSVLTNLSVDYYNNDPSMLHSFFLV